MNALPELPLTRRGLLKAGGALIVGFSLGSALAGEAQAAPLKRGAVAGPPDPKAIDTWLAVQADNTATLYIGFAELGQGAATALSQVAAEELDLSLDQISTAQLDTNITPNQGGTYSSGSIARGAPPVRQAAAEARQALIQLASRRLGVPMELLSTRDGAVFDIMNDRKSITYGKLIGGKQFNLTITGNVAPKPASELLYKVVGKRIPRKDILKKIAGDYSYIQHIELPGMLHGRVVRPRGQRVYMAGAKVIWIDLRSVMHIKGAQIFQRGDFVGVVAPSEWDAIRASRDIKIMWDEPRDLPDDGELYQQMRAERTIDTVVAQAGDVDAAFAGAAHVIDMSAHAPYQSHATFAPNCALADVRRDSALVIATSQDIYTLRQKLSTVLGLPEQKVRVQFADGSGTYGHSCYDDVALGAAILSQLAKKPVRLQFMRHDEHGWDTYGPAHVGEVRVAADKSGRLIGYQYDGWQHNWSLVETSQQLALGTKWAEWPTFASQQVNPLVCGGQYKIANVKLINHHVPGGTYLRAAWLRSPLDLAFAFTSEQAIDELAHRLKKDPYAFRRDNIADERWLGVLDAAARAADWANKAARPKPSVYGTVIGRGIGLGTHLTSWGGAVADIEVNKETGVVKVKHLYGALDVGLVVNPANVEAQIMGQLVQTASRMLFEEVSFDTLAVTSLDWASYPVMRMKDCPEITPILVQRMDKPSSGAGEEVMAAAAAAIANAFFDATGKRMREFPFTPKRVLATLRGA